jgi:hypothetical protein
VAALPALGPEVRLAELLRPRVVVTHVLAVLGALTTSALLAISPKPWLVLLFFALVFGPGVLCNASFHAGATLRWRAYCPGVATGLLVYLPLSLLLAGLALREGLVSGPSLAAALAVAAAFHTVEVGHNVFKRW